MKTIIVDTLLISSLGPHDVILMESQEHLNAFRESCGKEKFPIQEMYFELCFRPYNSAHSDLQYYQKPSLYEKERGAKPVIKKSSYFLIEEKEKEFNHYN